MRLAIGAEACQLVKVPARHQGLELAQIMAGPTCGMMLADMGADVIKVEKLPGGDDTRSYSRAARSTASRRRS